MSTDSVLNLPEDHEDYDFYHGMADGIVLAASNALVAAVSRRVVGTAIDADGLLDEIVKSARMEIARQEKRS